MTWAGMVDNIFQSELSVFDAFGCNMQGKS